MPDASWSRSLEDLHVPRAIGWAPTLGYARIDREVLAICQAAMDRLAELGDDVVTVDPVFDEDPVGPWLTLEMDANAREIQHLRDTTAFATLDREQVAMTDAFGMGPGTVVTAGTDRKSGRKEKKG